MKFYIDSANRDEIRQAHQCGWVDGVTTNPSLVAKMAAAAGLKSQQSNPNNPVAYTGELKKFHDQLIQNICTDVQPGLVSAEVLSLQSTDMVNEGQQLSLLADNVVVKIPMTEQGLIAVRQLKNLGIKTNVTLVFSVVQALMAAKAGATLVSPFVGRLDDTGADGMQLIEQIIKCYTHYKYSTQVLVASVRSPLHVSRAAVLGAHVVTLPFKVMQSLTHHPLTQKGLDAFLKAAKNLA